MRHSEAEQVLENTFDYLDRVLNEDDSRTDHPSFPEPEPADDRMEEQGCFDETNTER